MSNELYIKIYTEMLKNDDPEHVGLDGLGAYILLACYARENGHMGVVRYKNKQHIMRVLMCNYSQKVSRLLNKLSIIKWIEVDEKFTIKICKWRKYQAILEKEKHKNNTKKKQNPCTYSLESLESVERKKKINKKDSKKVEPIEPIEPESFEQFWKSYPPCPASRKIKKTTVERWNILIESRQVTACDLIKSMLRYKTERDGDPQHTAGPQVFLGKTKEMWKAMLENPIPKKQTKQDKSVENLKEWADENN